MSQFYVQSSSGGGGGDVTQVNTQSGNAVPSAGVLLLNAYDTTENNVYGIETKGNTDGGNPPGTGVSNEQDVYLTNRFHGSITTTDDTTTILATCPMTLSPGTYQFVVHIVIYNVTDNQSESDIAHVAYQTNGGTPVVLEPPDFVILTDPANPFLPTANVDFQGAPNIFRVRVTGAVGKTVKWLCHGTYTVVS